MKKIDAREYTAVRDVAISLRKKIVIEKMENTAREDFGTYDGKGITTWDLDKKTLTFNGRKESE